MACSVLLPRCILQWQLSGAAAGEDKKSAEGMKDTAEAVAEEESDGYVLDMRDGSDLERESDFEDAAEDRRAPVRLVSTLKSAIHQLFHVSNTSFGIAVVSAPDATRYGEDELKSGWTKVKLASPPLSISHTDDHGPHE